jgi:hypothetical protein
MQPARPPPRGTDITIPQAHSITGMAHSFPELPNVISPCKDEQGELSPRDFLYLRQNDGQRNDTVSGEALRAAVGSGVQTLPIVAGDWTVERPYREGSGFRVQQKVGSSY